MFVSLENKEPPSCPHCHSHNVVVHEYRHKKVKDDKILGYLVTLLITYRTVWCNCCCSNGSESIPFISEHHRVTKRAEAELLRSD